MSATQNKRFFFNAKFNSDIKYITALFVQVRAIAKHLVRFCLFKKKKKKLFLISLKLKQFVFVSVSLTQRRLVIKTLRIPTYPWNWKAISPEISAFLELFEIVRADDFESKCKFNKSLGN